MVQKIFKYIKYLPCGVMLVLNLGIDIVAYRCIVNITEVYL